uniref:Uncharacterized protein n=1 Tax=Leersia perrieri TaxID=77586 RepID=A0A0D9WLE5_9ORYZ
MTDSSGPSVHDPAAGSVRDRTCGRFWMQFIRGEIIIGCGIRCAAAAGRPICWLSLPCCMRPNATQI